MFVAVVGAAAVLLGGVRAPAAAGGTQCLVISEVYGGGGNSGAVYNDDFIELHNRCATPQPLGQVEYRTQTGGSVEVLQLTTTTLAAGSYYLVEITTSGTTGANVPTPDKIFTLPTSADGMNAQSVTRPPLWKPASAVTR